MPRSTSAPPLVYTNLTVPMALAGDTLAVKVTSWPKTEFFAEELSFSEVGAVFTISLSVELALAR